MRIFLSILLLSLFTVTAVASTTASRQYNFVDDKNNTIPITASRVDAELDNIITKLNQKVLIKTTAPSSPIAGTLWYDSTTKKLKEYRNNEWVGVGVNVSGSVVGTPQDGDVWYNTTADSLNIYNGSSWSTLFSGNSDLYISGNVGIGTTIINERLRVVGNTASTSRMRLYYNASEIGSFSSYSGYVGSGNETDLLITTPNNLYLSVGGTDRAFISSTGNVGIGTTIPLSKLEVSGQIHSKTTGFKFPDNTTQATATASFTGVITDDLNLSGDLAITGVGFQPTIVVFHAVFVGDPLWSHGVAKSTSDDNCVYFDGTLTGTFAGVWKLGGATAVLKSMDSGGFTVTRTGSGSGATKILYTAYK